MLPMHKIRSARRAGSRYVMETSLTSLAQSLEARETMAERLETLVNSMPHRHVHVQSRGRFWRYICHRGRQNALGV